LTAAWMTHLALPYAWTVAAVQFSIAMLALAWACPLLERGWWRTTAAPALAAALAGLGAGWLLPANGQPLKIQLAIQAAVFGVAAALALRMLFGAVLARLVARVPAGRYVRRLLFLAAPSLPVQTQESET